MNWITETWRRLRSLGRRADAEDGLDDELRFHVEQQTAKNLRAGMTPDEARRQALVQFGALERTKEQTRDEFRAAPLEDLARDVRYSVRALRHAPGFTVVAILTLALGIGATTAVFSVVHGVLIKPLPYPDAGALVDLRHVAPGIDIPGGTVYLSATQLFTYREHGRAFQEIGLWQTGASTVAAQSDPHQVQSLLVTEGTLQALGVPPALGRWFTKDDDAPGSAETVVLTHGYWQRSYGGDRTVIGRDILIDSRPRQIIGVMPADFRFLNAAPDVILPFRFDRARLFLGQFNYRGIARLSSGTTLADANADVARMIPIWLRAWPPPPGADVSFFENAQFTPAFRPLKQQVVGDVDNVLWVLMGTVGLVLLIACANVANLLLVRAEGRHQEMAVRSALGASRGRLVRSLLVESVVLGLAGGAVGLALAFAGVRLIVAAAPPGLPRLHDIAVDPTVLVFTVIISLLAGLVFGMAPALRRASASLVQELRGSGRTSSQSRERRRARNALVVVQVSLATVLLVASGLMMRSFVALSRVEPGFTDPASVQMLRIAIPPAQIADPEQVFRVQAEIRERIAAIPGVSSVSFVSAGPMQQANAGDPLFVEGRTYAPGQMPPIRPFKFVAPGYFDTAGTRIIAGRDISWTDVQSRLPVAVVAESLARDLWGEPAAALGARVRENPEGAWREVIGVVADVRDGGLQEAAPSTVYWPALLADFYGTPVQVRRSVAFVLRTERAGTESLLADVREAVRAVNASLPIADATTLGDLYERSLAPTSFTLVMLAIAGVMALLLSVIGIYGVLSYAVTQRTREIGIRAALGAPTRGLRAMFVREGLVLTAVGVGCGLVAASLLTRAMTALLVGVDALDPATYAAVAVVLAVAAALAAYVPAHRATAVSPVEVLRGM